MRRRILALRDVSRVLAPLELLEEVEAPDSREVDRLAVRPGDIVATARGARIRTAVATSEHAGVLVGPNLVLVRLISPIPPTLIAAYLRHPAIEADLQSDFAGVGTPGFSVERLRQLPIELIPEVISADLVELTDLTEMRLERVVEAAQLQRDAVTELVFRHLAPRAAP